MNTIFPLLIISLSIIISGNSIAADNAELSNESFRSILEVAVKREFILACDDLDVKEVSQGGKDEKKAKIIIGFFVDTPTSDLRIKKNQETVERLATDVRCFMFSFGDVLAKKEEDIIKFIIKCQDICKNANFTDLNDWTKDNDQSEEVILEMNNIEKILIDSLKGLEIRCSPAGIPSHVTDRAHALKYFAADFSVAKNLNHHIREFLVEVVRARARQERFSYKNSVNNYYLGMCGRLAFQENYRHAQDAEIKGVIQKSFDKYVIRASETGKNGNSSAVIYSLPFAATNVKFIYLDTVSFFHTRNQKSQK